MIQLRRTHRVSVAWMRERFPTPSIKSVSESTNLHRNDTYTETFRGFRKCYAACLQVNVVDDRSAELLTSFTKHTNEITESSKKAKPHDLYEYTAAPSVKRQGGVTKAHGQETHDIRDDLNHGFAGFPFHERAGDSDYVHERAGDSGVLFPPTGGLLRKYPGC